VSGFKEFKLQVLSCVITVVVNVSFDDFSRHFVSRRAGKVAICPELAAPDLSFDLWMFPKDGSRT